MVLLDLKSGKQTLLAKNANTPTWSANGKKVYYQRNAYSLVEFDIESGKEQVLFTSGLGQVRKGAILQTPHFSDTTNNLLPIGTGSTAVGLIFTDYKKTNNYDINQTEIVLTFTRSRGLDV